MERMAKRILDAIGDVRIGKHDLDYLAWYLVYNAPKPMQRRLIILADAIIQHHYTITEENDDDDTLF